MAAHLTLHLLPVLKPGDGETHSDIFLMLGPTDTLGDAHTPFLRGGWLRSADGSPWGSPSPPWEAGVPPPQNEPSDKTSSPHPSQEEGMAAHSSVFGWMNMRSLAGCSPWGCKESATEHVCVPPAGHPW